MNMKVWFRTNMETLQIIPLCFQKNFSANMQIKEPFIKKT